MLQGIGEAAAEHEGADDGSNAGQALVGTLKLPLCLRADTPGHEALQAGTQEIAQCEDGRRRKIGQTRRRKAVAKEAGCGPRTSDEERAPLAQPSDHRPDHKGLHEYPQGSGQEHGQADGLEVPIVAIAGVEDEDRRQDVVRNLEQEADGRQACQLAMLKQELQGTDRIGAAPVEPGAAAFRRQGLRQDEKAVKEVEEGQGAGNRKGQPDGEVSDKRLHVGTGQKTSENRSDQEAKPEGSPHVTEIARPLVDWRDVRHIGVGGGEAGGSHAVHDPRDE